MEMLNINRDEDSHFHLSATSPEALGNGQNHNTVFSSSIIGEDYLSTLLYFTIIASCQLQHLQRNYPLFTKILLIGTASIVAIVHGNIV